MGFWDLLFHLVKMGSSEQVIEQCVAHALGMLASHSQCGTFMLCLELSPSRTWTNIRPNNHSETRFHVYFTAAKYAHLPVITCDFHRLCLHDLCFVCSWFSWNNQLLAIVRHNPTWHVAWIIPWDLICLLVSSSSTMATAAQSSQMLTCYNLRSYIEYLAPQSLQN